jgi:hypothetical protein
LAETFSSAWEKNSETLAFFPAPADENGWRCMNPSPWEWTPVAAS